MTTPKPTLDRAVCESCKETCAREVEAGPGPGYHETTSDVLEAVAFNVRSLPSPPSRDRDASDLVEALERIRDDYGDVWGGTRVKGPRGSGEFVMLCMCCGEEAETYAAIKHDEDCPVFIASAALDAWRRRTSPERAVAPTTCVKCKKPVGKWTLSPEGVCIDCDRPLAGRDARHLEDEPEPTKCETWCGFTRVAGAGIASGCYPNMASCFPQKTDQSETCYCTAECRLAGMPLHPRSPK